MSNHLICFFVCFFVNVKVHERRGHVESRLHFRRNPLRSPSLPWHFDTKSTGEDHGVHPSALPRRLLVIPLRLLFCCVPAIILPISLYLLLFLLCLNNRYSITLHGLRLLLTGKVDDGAQTAFEGPPRLSAP